MAFLFADYNLLREIIAFRCSKLPIRLYDTIPNRFVTRRELQQVVEAQVITYLRSRPRFEQIYDVPYDIKGKTMACTKFAILSHTWSDNELTYQNVCENRHRLQQDPKFLGLCNTAKSYGCRYIWIDTICIDKSSSAELDESIRSMYTWYTMSYVCIVYLDEFVANQHPTDRWFRRGWTLQELLAPRRMVFFGKGWRRVFSPTRASSTLETECEGGFDILRRFRRLENVDASDIDVDQYSQDEGAVDSSILSHIAACTGISHEDLESYEPSPRHIRIICTYMHRRSTTIPEDAAYCLIGLLGIVLPTAYGEGKQHALHRLQVACAELTNDRNIFLGDYSHGCSPFNSMLPLNPFRPHPYHTLGLLRNPKISVNGLWDSFHGADQPDHTFAFTNGGLRISLTLHDIFYAYEPQGTLPSSTRKLYCACSADPIQTTYHSMDPADTLEQFKLAILGTYTVPDKPWSYAYAIILERINSSNIQTYRRTAITVFPQSLPPLHLLLSHPPVTVYIV